MLRNNLKKAKKLVTLKNDITDFDSILEAFLLL